MALRYNQTMQSHKRYQPHLPGFTLIELLVIVTILILVITIGFFNYSQIERQSRDARRAADINQIAAALETFYLTKGAYPAGCPSATCSASLFTNNTSSAPITATTTSVQLASILPNIANTIHDPSFNDGMPFLDRTLTPKKYFYYGGGVNTTAASATTSSSSSATFPCDLTMTLPAGKASGFILGYYDQGNSRWRLQASRAAEPIALTGPAPDCQIN